MARLPRLLFCALVACLLAGCGGKPRDPVADLQIFFQQVAEGKTDEAYKETAFSFQSQRNAEAFGKAAQEMGLVGAANVQWDAPEMDGRSAKFRVTVKNRAGQDMPLNVTLLDENGAWRIFSLRSPPNEKTGLSENRFSLAGKLPSLVDAAQQPTPTTPEVITLTRDSLLKFNEAIASKSFDNFYDSVSRKWQDQLTKGQLQRAFQPFIDKGVKLDAITQSEPVFDPQPTVTSDGLLVVSGHYPTEPYRVYFNLKFYYELPVWKLFGLEVQMRQ